MNSDTPMSVFKLGRDLTLQHSFSVRTFTFGVIDNIASHNIKILQDSSNWWNRKHASNSFAAHEFWERGEGNWRGPTNCLWQFKIK